MKTTIKKLFILCLLFVLILLITLKSYANTISSNLSNNFFRLHILANSNSEEDQNLKLKVRDNIINYMNSLDYSVYSKDTAINITEENLTTLKNIAEETIKENGYNYTVTLEVGNYYFPTKKYGNISLPAGNYDALRIKIGEAQGQNWWCSLFPPLCFTDVSAGIVDEESTEMLENSLTSEEFAIITDNSESVKLKFKIIELFSHKNAN